MSRAGSNSNNRAQKFMASQPPPLKNILVAVPSTGGLMKAKTAETLFKIAALLTRNGITPDMVNLNGSDVVTVRNVYANTLLNSKRWDSLLFIDSDMEFDPGLIMKMVRLNAGVTAAACTTRELDLMKFHKAMLAHGDIDLARAESSRFTVLKTFNNHTPTVIKKVSGFYSMAAAGMAVCLIRKSALQAMVKEGAVDKRVDVRDGKPSESWGFFDHLRVGEVVLLEDFSFCYRWTETMKRQLWVCVDSMVKHLGDFEYGAKYQPVLERELRPMQTRDSGCAEPVPEVESSEA